MERGVFRNLFSSRPVLRTVTHRLAQQIRGCARAGATMARGMTWDSGLYDDKHSFVWKLAVGVLDLVKPQRNERILDVGCDTTHLTAKIASVGAIRTGIDLSLGMIRQARERYPRLHFQVMDAREITFTESFDAIFSNAALPERHGFEGIYAELFDRPTHLDDGERGRRNWIEMFGDTFLRTVSGAQREQFAADVEREARPTLFRDSQWVMDYRRLPIAASRTSGPKSHEAHL